MRCVIYRRLHTLLCMNMIPSSEEDYFMKCIWDLATVTFTGQLRMAGKVLEFTAAWLAPSGSGLVFMISAEAEINNFSLMGFFMCRQQWPYLVSNSSWCSGLSYFMWNRGLRICISAFLTFLWQ